jgi:hypothetical protein
MEKKLDYIREKSKEMTLQEDERKSLRDSLISHIDKNPPVEKIVSPWSSFFHLRSIQVGTLVLILVITGSGISVAANSSLPGDVLYPVKRKVNERVKGFFAFSHEDKAQLEVVLASERLEEAEKLHADAHLSSTTEARLEEDFENHIQTYNNEVDILKKNKDEKNAQAAHTVFETSLKNHQKILKMFAGQKEQEQSKETEKDKHTIYQDINTEIDLDQ